ncbi:MAG: prepilin-type N-terminal cleavage/methylation domain-containing protein [Phycisphaerae bacterium]|jgi:prepilin-type N-terminal cleavage/methylation domain-containing protein
MNNRIRKGFTLVEILIVVVILGILASVVVPQFTNATSEATAGNLKAQLRSLQNQIELYAARNNGSYPITAAAANWNLLRTGGYIKADPINPASTAADKTTVSVVTTGGTRGAAASAWVWNTADTTIYASFFNETTGVVTQTATD